MNSRTRFSVTKPPIHMNEIRLKVEAPHNSQGSTNRRVALRERRALADDAKRLRRRLPVCLPVHEAFCRTSGSKHSQELVYSKKISID